MDPRAALCRPCATVAGSYSNDHRQPREVVLARFWANVTKTDTCWLWTGRQTTTGYGSFAVDGKKPKAHRFAYELAVGPIPDGVHVCHHCDVPLCVRPDHLFLGTDADNQADKVRKGRQLRGDTHPSALLSEADVQDIRNGYMGTWGEMAALAREYGVHPGTVRAILVRENWRHLG